MAVCFQAAQIAQVVVELQVRIPGKLNICVFILVYKAQLPIKMTVRYSKRHRIVDDTVLAKQHDLTVKNRFACLHFLNCFYLQGV